MLGTKSPAVDQQEAAFEPEADESDSSIQQCVYSLHQEQPTRQRRFGSEHLFRTLLVTCSHTSIATKKVMDNLSLKMITIFGPNFLRPRRLFCHFMPTRAGAMGGVTMFASYTRASGPRKGQTYVFECSTVGRGLEAKSCRADRGLPTLSGLQIPWASTGLTCSHSASTQSQNPQKSATVITSLTRESSKPHPPLSKNNKTLAPQRSLCT